MMILIALGLVIDICLVFANRSPDPSGLFGCPFSGGGCNAILNSPFGRVLGISLVWWGLTYHLILGLIAGTVRNVPSLPARLVMAVACAPGVAAAGWLVYVMITQTDGYCVWCLAGHSVNVTLMWVAVFQCRTAWNRQHMEATQYNNVVTKGRLLAASIVTAIVLIVWQVGVLAFFHDPVDLIRVPIPGHARPLAELSVTHDERVIRTVLGDRNSSKHLVVFSCFTCQRCRKLHQMLAKIQERNGHPIRIDLRFAPLASDCNPLAEVSDGSSTEHQHACLLARLALAVAIQNDSQFGSYVEWLVEHQDSLSPSSAEREAERRCQAEVLCDEEMIKVIEWRLARDVDLARQFGVTSVPEVFVADGRLSGSMTEWTLKRVLAKGSPGVSVNQTTSVGFKPPEVG